MILSNTDIRKCLELGQIKITPLKDNSIGPCSVDLHLADKFCVFKTGHLMNPEDREAISRTTETVCTEGEAFHLAPGQFILASTQEKISIPKNMAATLEGRSSVARLGIVVHAAGLVNPGTGMKKPTELTLEIFCQANSTVKLVPGMGIVQIIFHMLKSEASIGYDERENSQYIGLSEPRV